MIGVVMPVGEGRRENAEDVLESLLNMSDDTAGIVLVLDGHSEKPSPPPTTIPIALIETPRHEPGMTQPRNLGVSALSALPSECTHVWFVDSDVLVDHHALAAYLDAIDEVGPDTILIGPYEWLPEGVRWPTPELHNDPRTEMFAERGRGPFVADLGVALGCFSGNLIWPIDRFVEVGGFHSMLHHGRCEDGELGLRAASHRIPMALVPEARGYHMAHPINLPLVLERNRRDVPLINKWHPWVHEAGLIVTTDDGARFDYQCACGAQVNTLEMWGHRCREGVVRTWERQDDLILPDGL